MSIPAISKQIGKTKLKKSGNQKYQYMHATTHFVRDEDLSTYTMEVMDTVDVNKASLFTVPVNAQCQSQSIVGNGSMGWIVTTEFGSGTYMYNLGNVVPEDLQAISYSVGELFCPSEFWGLRKANKDDVTAKIYSRLRDGDCKEFDILQKGATNTDAGDVDMNQCPIGWASNTPFEDVSIPTYFDWMNEGSHTGYLNQKIPTVRLTVTFVASKSPHQYASFIGVNPDGFAGTPFALQPSMKLIATWRAVSQSIVQVNIKGNTKYKVTRVMEKAPEINAARFQTSWLINKNGGIWTW